MSWPDVSEDKDFYPLVRPSDAAGVFVDELDPRFSEGEDKFKDDLLDAMRWGGLASSPLH